MNFNGNYSSSNKRSPSTPPMNMYKHPRTDSVQSANMHFPMNNSSY